jgi:hypothetical protein
MFSRISGFSYNRGVWRQCATTCKARGYFAKLLDRYNIENENSPGSHLRDLAETHFLIGNFDTSIQLFEEMIHHSGLDSQLWHNIISNYLRTERRL